MKTTTHTLVKIALASAVLISGARAEYFQDTDPGTLGDQPGSIYVPVGLGGTTKSEGWELLTSTEYPGNGTFPGWSSWTGTSVVSQVGPNAGSSALVKLGNGVGGGPYPGSQSIYFGGTGIIPNIYGGELAVQATGTDVLPGVKTVVFQVDIGEAWTYDFYSRNAPVLVCTTTLGTFTLSPQHTSLYAALYNGEVYMNFQWEDLFINSWAFQYNLASLSGTVTSISLEFEGAQHAQVYGLGLEQSTQTELESVLPVLED